MASIDPTEYVQAPPGAKSLKFPDEKVQAHFELGVTMAVHRWEELTIAVDNLWGGPNSADKRDWISATVIDLFDDTVVDIQAIEETLLYAMVDEFDTQVDNDSALGIAHIIMSFYKRAAVNDFSDIDELYQKWCEKQQNRQKQLVNVQSDPNNPSSDEEEGDDYDAPAHNHMDEDTNMDEDKGPIVDDDGFTLVQKKGRR